MAVKLFQLASVSPTVYATSTDYFMTVTATTAIAASASASWSAAKWSTGTGGTPSSFASAGSGRYLMYINGVLQQRINVTVLTASKVHFKNNGTATYTIAAGSPITLSLANVGGMPTKVAVP